MCNWDSEPMVKRDRRLQAVIIKLFSRRFIWSSTVPADYHGQISTLISRHIYLPQLRWYLPEHGPRSIRGRDNLNSEAEIVSPIVTWETPLVPGGQWKWVTTAPCRQLQGHLSLFCNHSFFGPMVFVVFNFYSYSIRVFKFPFAPRIAATLHIYKLSISGKI